MGWGINEEVTNEDIIEAIIELYPELHQVRNHLCNNKDEMAGYMKHTCGNLQAILSYYKAKQIEESET